MCIVGASAVVPPEVLLHLPVTEKVDVWHLAASICEAIAQKRISSDSTSPLCDLVDFLGPLPDSVVDQHPQREKLFTPQGQLLRPTTPDVSGVRHMDVIGPPVSSHWGEFPRPRRVVDALTDVEGADEILAFLGPLLHPDPKKRPSVVEANAHTFLKKHVRKSVGIAEDSEVSMVQRCSDTATTVITAQCKTGAVKAGVFEQMLRSACEGGLSLTMLSTGEQPNEESEPKRHCEGTDTADMQDINKTLLQASCESRHCALAATGVVKRKFGCSPVRDLKVMVSDGAKRDIGEAEGSAPHVRIAAPVIGSQSKGRLGRKGTGFVQLGELPTSDDDDEDDDEETPRGGVRIDGSQSSSTASTLRRKGTGFAHKVELSSSEDGSSEHEVAGNRIVAFVASDGAHAETYGRPVARKGTGFVQVTELPSSDDSAFSDDDDPTVKSNQELKRVVVQGPPKKATGRRASLDLDEEDTECRIKRKGTGFVQVTELPSSDLDSDDETDADQPKTAVKIFSEGLGEKDTRMVRKCTGFLTDDAKHDDHESNADNCRRVRLVEPEGEQSGTMTVGAKLARKGTGIVNLSELPDSEDEDENDEEEDL